jgi:flagellar motor switch protein FliN/FliY
MNDEEHDDETGDAGATDDGGFDPAALAAMAFSEAAGSDAAADDGDDDEEWEEVEGEDDAGAGTMAFDFPSFDEGGPASPTGDLAMLDDVSLKVSVELGRTRMFVEDVLRLVPEAVIELDKAAGDPVDVFVNGRHVARGEVLVLNENFCVRINEIISASDEDD